MYELHTLTAEQVQVSQSIPPVFVHGGILLATALALVWFRARLVEFIRCRRMMRALIQDEPSDTLTLSQFITLRVMRSHTFGVTAAELIEKMATTRSRWIVLHLACFTVRDSSVRDFFLSVFSMNGRRTRFGQAGVSSFWSAGI